MYRFPHPITVIEFPTWVPSRCVAEAFAYCQAYPFAGGHYPMSWRGSLVRRALRII